MNMDSRIEDSASHIRFSGPGDRDALLQFIRDMGFNARDAATWDQLGMCAATAWRSGTLVGAIPLEPRWLQIDPGVVVPTVHVTTTAVAPELRGQGTGSRLQAAILEHPPNGGGCPGFSGRSVATPARL